MRISRVSVILAGVAAAAMLLAAQGRGGTPIGGSTTGGNTGAPSTTSIPTPNSPSSTSNSTNPSIPGRGEFFFGKVVMPDGTAPPMGAVIERVCNGAARPQAYTDNDGNFSFQVGQTQEMLPDATEEANSPSNSPSLRGISQTTPKNGAMPYTCDLRASLAGYRSDLVSLAGRRQDDPNIGTIMLHPYAKPEGLTMSATSALAPKDAHKAFEKGLEAMRKSKLEEAEADFQKATDLYPRYASAWLELGRVYELRKKLPEARDAYNKAIAGDSKFIKPYEQLYMLSFQEQKWDDLAQMTERVMHLNPYDYPDAVYFNAVANSQLGKLDLAEKSARQALTMGSGNPKVYYILGVILAKKQHFKEAAECLRTYLKSDAVIDRERVKQMLAEFERQVQAKAQLKPEP
jgi:tetratricopeptide (TPR) repeat protein